jgi:LPXTG-motif cell wall-anchored protein
VTITEDSGAYTASYRMEDGTYTYSNTCTLEALTQDTSITCVNATGYALPNTGGHGTTLYTISGLALMVFAVVCWKRRRSLV